MTEAQKAVLALLIDMGLEDVTPEDVDALIEAAHK